MNLQIYHFKYFYMNSFSKLLLKNYFIQLGICFYKNVFYKLKFSLNFCVEFFFYLKKTVKTSIICVLLKNVLNFFIILLSDSDIKI